MTIADSIFQLKWKKIKTSGELERERKRERDTQRGSEREMKQETKRQGMRRRKKIQKRTSNSSDDYSKFLPPLAPAPASPSSPFFRLYKGEREITPGVEKRNRNEPRISLRALFLSLSPTHSLILFEILLLLPSSCPACSVCLSTPPHSLSLSPALFLYLFLYLSFSPSVSLLSLFPHSRSFFFFI